MHSCLQDANLWDVSVAPTIVMTQRGARTEFQQKLRAQGVEVVEFDFLTPHAVAAYCYDRGFLQCLWECGGTLAAPAISAGVIHKTLAFIAPKLVSGCVCLGTLCSDPCVILLGVVCVLSLSQLHNCVLYWGHGLSSNTHIVFFLH